MRRWAVVVAALAACRAPSRTEVPRANSDDYASAAMWVCRPDKADDPCHKDLTATELRADGSKVRVEHVPATAPQVDCFYVYPTVDLRLRAGNHDDLTDLEAPRRTALAQIARFREVCDVFAPAYRQVTIGTYLGSQEDKDRFFPIAYSDVAAAFAYYLKHLDHGRKLVMVGHSQGAQMIAMLLRDTFDRDAALRERLLVAMPIGFYFDVPKGGLVGGSFQNLPVCTTDDQTRCVVAYRTLGSGDQPDPKVWPLPENRRAICVNPAGALQGPVPLTGTFFPTERAGVKGVDTPFVLLSGLYHGGCTTDPGGRDFFEVKEVRKTDDQRPSLLDFSRHKGGIGLHVYDMTLPQGDLITLLKKKAATLP